jgi:asparagine synthase (glutamine-hydrolysing)
MAAAMYKRNEFASGTYVDEKLQIYVGWTSHRGSYTDCLPVKSTAGDLMLFFAGEHFAPDGDEEESPAAKTGYSGENAEALLPLYVEMGEKFFSYLNGFFHGLIVDSRQGKVFLFNDRFGMQRLYIYEEPDAFYFASEAKSILAIRPGLRAFDLRGLGEWLSCGAVLENRSLFQGLEVLPAASLLTRRRSGVLERGTYFSPETWENLPKLGPSEFYSKLQSTFVRRLPAYLKSDGLIGLSTTGGLDTRMILANLGMTKGRIHCYSFDGPYRENLDVSIGRKVAQAVGLPHTTIPITRGFFRQFGQIAEDVVLSTDGNLEMSGAANIFVNRAAKEISPVRLTGNYGSEILRRHQAFSPSKSIRRALQKPWAESVDRASMSLKDHSKAHPLSFVAFRQIPWYSFNRLQAEQSVLVMRSPFLDIALLKAAYQAPEESSRSRETSLRLIHDGNRELAEIPTDRGVTYPKKPTWIFARLYYEFVFKMEYYASHGMPRHIALIDKHLGSLGLERNFLGRNKYYHLHKWFRDELSTYVRDILLDEKSLSREYIDRREVTRAVRAHMAGTENNTELIDKLITLELANRFLLGA